MKTRDHAGLDRNVKEYFPRQMLECKEKLGSRFADETISRDFVNLIP